jgi:hypothetical protein
MRFNTELTMLSCAWAILSSHLVAWWHFRFMLTCLCPRPHVSQPVPLGQPQRFGLRSGGWPRIVPAACFLCRAIALQHKNCHPLLRAGHFELRFGRRWHFAFLALASPCPFSGFPACVPCMRSRKWPQNDPGVVFLSCRCTSAEKSQSLAARGPF